MNFTDAVKTCLKKWITVTGRAPRSEFWWFFLFNFLVSLCAQLLMAKTQSSILGFIFLLGFIYLLIASIAVGVRRLHDTNRSGWWLLIGFLPVIGGIILLIFYLLPSTIGKNRFA